MSLANWVQRLTAAQCTARTLMNFTKICGPMLQPLLALQSMWRSQNLRVAMFRGHKHLLCEGCTPSASPTEMCCAHAMHINVNPTQHRQHPKVCMMCTAVQLCYELLRFSGVEEVRSPPVFACALEIHRRCKASPWTRSRQSIQPRTRSLLVSDYSPLSAPRLNCSCNWHLMHCCKYIDTSCM